MFEPTHGSAPKYEELDPPIVNPIAMILSAAMLLDHVGETEKAAADPGCGGGRGRRGEGPDLRHDEGSGWRRVPSSRAPPRRSRLPTPSSRSSDRE